MKTIMNRLSYGLVWIGFGFLFGAFFAGSCTNGDDASAQSTSAPVHQIHVSSTSGPHAVAASSANALVREVTFTPTSPNDVILYVYAEGTYTASSVGSFDSTGIEVRDAAGQVSGGAPQETVNFIVGTSRGFRNITTLALAKRGDQSWSFPSSSYTVRLTITTGSGWSGQINSLTFKIVTLESVTVSSPSTSISG